MFLGLDLSIRSTGFFILGVDGSIYGTIKSTTDHINPVRYRAIADEILELVLYHKVEFIGMEDYAYNAAKFKSSNFTNMCELRGVVLDNIHKHCKTKTIVSTQLKKFITGKGKLKSGNEGKQEVVDAVNLEYGFDFKLKDNDIADACVLANIMMLSEKPSLEKFNLQKYQRDIIKDIRSKEWLY